MSNSTVDTFPKPISTTELSNVNIATASIIPIGGISVSCSTYRKALLFSLWDGIFANAMVALVDTFAVAAAVYLKAPAIAIAMLSSIPLLFSSICQFFLPYFVSPSSGRKKFVVTGVTVQSLSLFLLGCSGWLPSHLQTWTFVVIFAIYGFSGNLGSSFWISWIGDLVPSNVRGRHFAWRNRFFSITQLLCTLTAGIITCKYSTDSAKWMLFAFVFFTAGIFRWVSAQFLNFQYEPPSTIKTRIRFNVSDLKTMRPFLLFCLATGLMQGVTALSAPFFNVWYVRDLHFNFFSLSVASASTVLGTILSLRLWGVLCDSIGNRRILHFTGLLICFVPFPYIFLSAPWQIWLLNFYSGISWSGYNLSYFNYVLIGSGNVAPEKKIIFSVAINGIFSFFFSLIGGYLSTRLPVLFHWQLSTLFLLSGTMRLIIFFALYNRFPHFEFENSINSYHFRQFFDYKNGINFIKTYFKTFLFKFNWKGKKSRT